MSSFHFLLTKDIAGWTRARFTTSQFKGWGKKLLFFHNNEAFSAHVHRSVNEWFSCANNIGHNVSFLEKKKEYIFVNNFNSYFRSEEFTYLGLKLEAFLCLRITQQSSTKYTYDTPTSEWLYYYMIKLYRFRLFLVNFYIFTHEHNVINMVDIIP